MAKREAAFDCLVLDGGVLTEWFRALYVAGGRTWPSKTSRRFTRHFLTEPYGLRAWERVLSWYPNKLHISSYAIAEVQRHVQDSEEANSERMEGDFRRACWRNIYTALAKYPVQEHHVPWTLLNKDLLHDYGPADASLVELAWKLRIGRQRPCIVTTDGDLRRRCTEPDLGLSTKDPNALLTTALT